MAVAMPRETVREHEVFFAKLAEQSERYDEMAEHMRTVCSMDEEPSAEERNLLFVAYKQATASRRAAWRVVCAVESQERSKGDASHVACSQGIRQKIEAELRELCGAIIQLLHEWLIPRASRGDAKVFFFKQQGDYHRYLAEISDDSERTTEAQEAQNCYEDGTGIAEDQAGLSVVNPARLGLALNHAVFYFEVKRDPERAVGIARKAFEDAMRELDSASEEGTSEGARLIMHLLRDNINLWTSAAD